MSAALDRILRAVYEKGKLSSLIGQIPIDTLYPDHSGDETLSFGDWKDAIGSELHTLKLSLLEIAQECDENELTGTATKIRMLAGEL